MILTELLSTFYYDESSKTHLRWNIDKFTGEYRSIHSTVKHSEAGWINTQGYAEVKWNGK